MKPTALAIIKEVAEAYGVTTDDLRSKSRIARFADARAVVCYLLYRYYNYGWKDVGRMVLRDHSSVMHSVRLVEGFCLWPKMYATDLAIIEDIKQKYFSDGQ
ncbi:helix-turn-helix domain-containing protein [Enterococcus innesii]|uniref:helix-turn-helix domain-containing protein n=1 Tax=Enterococcus innesii TaxID=2839759 RepID=UPI003DA65D45